MPERRIDVTDEDLEMTELRWYGDDSFFIRQQEKGEPGMRTMMFNRHEAVQLRDALNEFLTPR